MQPQTAPRNYQQEFHDELNLWQKETPYPLTGLPNGQLPPNFFNIVDDAFAFEIPVGLKVNEEDFRRLQSLEGTEINLIDMGTVLYVLEKRTRAEYQWEKEEYLQYRDMVNILTAEWRKVCEPKSNELKEKYNALIEEEKAKIQGINEELLQKGGNYKNKRQKVNKQVSAELKELIAKAVK